MTRFRPVFRPAPLSVASSVLAVLLAGCGGNSSLTAPAESSSTLAVATSPSAASASRPNILLVISDDVGLDGASGYAVTSDLPSTPTLDRLAATGVTFDNAWANPICSPTRATILTGRYGFRTGVRAAGDAIPLTEMSLQAFIDRSVPNTYEHAVFGKWHLGGDGNGGNNNPGLMGIPQFFGLGAAAGAVPDFFSWTQVENGQSSRNQTYTTTAFVDSAIQWIAARKQPWFAWVAFNAAHTPFHLPPGNLHGRTGLSSAQSAIDANPRPYFLAAIEAMDTELGRLLNSLSAEARANTIVIYLGDNGTPGQVIRGHQRTHAKGSVYQGGVAVPLIVSGAGVTRAGARESALVSSVDLFATIASLAGAGASQVHDSLSFTGLLSDGSAARRSYAYTETLDAGRDDWAIRNQRYKLVQRVGAAQELYDLQADPFELSDLAGRGGDVASVLTELRTQAGLIRQ